MNDVAKDVRYPFDITGAITAYKDQDEGYEPGRRLWEKVGDHQMRKLNGRLVPVVLFTMDIDPTWYWVPREEFDRLARPADIAGQTSIPFQKWRGVQPRSPKWLSADG
jgi:hypothetical protein